MYDKNGNQVEGLDIRDFNHNLIPSTTRVTVESRNEWYAGFKRLVLTDSSKFNPDGSPYNLVLTLSSLGILCDKIAVPFNILAAPGVDFSGIPSIFSTETFYVSGETAFSTDVLRSALLANGFGLAGVTELIKGRTDSQLKTDEYESGNLVCFGGPLVNRVTEYFNEFFNVGFRDLGNQYEIYAEDQLIQVEKNSFNEGRGDIAVVYLGLENNRYGMEPMLHANTCLNP